MSDQPGTPFDQGPLTPEQLTARLLVLEHLVLNVTSTLTAELARQNGLTLDGIRSNLGSIHQAMLGNLLETNQGAFEAGLPYAGTITQRLFGSVKVMLESSAKKAPPHPTFC